MKESGRVIVHDLSRYLTTLGTIAALSPLMGLFGTLVGMIEIFGSNSPTGSNQRSLLMEFLWLCIMRHLAYSWQFPA